MITNEEFGLRVDCSESMASRLRSGDRRPGADLRDRIVREFDLDPNEAIDAYASATTFGAFLRKNVFDANRVAA